MPVRFEAQPTSASDVVSVLARATLYRIFALAFQAPSEERWYAMGARSDFGILEDALRCLGAGRQAETEADVACLREAGRSPEALAADYARLFGHTTRGVVCPCETEYGDERAFRQPQQLADISGYYLAFGLVPPASIGIRQDHVACECEFLAFLCMKEAHFLAGRRKDADATQTLAVTRDAIRSFLGDHLAHFGRAFASRLSAEENGRYYSAWGALFARFLDGECARAGIAGGPTELSVRTELIDDAPMACGSGDELIQIQRRS